MRSKKGCLQILGCDWAAGAGGGQCSKIQKATEADCNFEDGSNNKRPKNECRTTPGCSWAAGKGGGQCSVIIPEEENDVCEFKPGSKSMRSKEECSEKYGCAWDAGAGGGGKCNLDVPVRDSFWSWLWYKAFVDPKCHTEL